MSAGVGYAGGENNPPRIAVETAGRTEIAIVTPVSQVWRVGFPGDPLRVPEARDQGDGRFDDPARVVPVLYCGDTLETCVYETIDQYGVAAHDDAVKVLTPTDSAEDDPEGEEDARRDRMIADRQRRVPPAFYDRCGVQIALSHPAFAFDLTMVENRTALQNIASVATAMVQASEKELDLHAITSPRRALTQTIAGELIRGGLSGPDIHGIMSFSRRQGTIYALFCDGRFPVDLHLMDQRRLTPYDDVVCRVAAALGIRP